MRAAIAAGLASNLAFRVHQISGVIADPQQQGNLRGRIGRLKLLTDTQRAGHAQRQPAHGGTLARSRPAQQDGDGAVSLQIGEDILDGQVFSRLCYRGEHALNHFRTPESGAQLLDVFFPFLVCEIAASVETPYLLVKLFAFKRHAEARAIRDGAQMDKNLLQRDINGEDGQRGRLIDARRIDEPVATDDAIQVVVQKSLALRRRRRAHGRLAMLVRENERRVGNLLEVIDPPLILSLDRIAHIVMALLDAGSGKPRQFLRGAASDQPGEQREQGQRAQREQRQGEVQAGEKEYAKGTLLKLAGDLLEGQRGNIGGVGGEKGCKKSQPEPFQAREEAARNGILHKSHTSSYSRETGCFDNRIVAVHACIIRQAGKYGLPSRFLSGRAKARQATGKG